MSRMSRNLASCSTCFAASHILSGLSRQQSSNYSVRNCGHLIENSDTFQSRMPRRWYHCTCNRWQINTPTSLRSCNCTGTIPLFRSCKTTRSLPLGETIRSSCSAERIFICIASGLFELPPHVDGECHSLRRSLSLSLLPLSLSLSWLIWF